jgi:hypothetical protein
MLGPEHLYTASTNQSQRAFNWIRERRTRKHIIYAWLSQLLYGAVIIQWKGKNRSGIGAAHDVMLVTKGIHFAHGVSHNGQGACEVLCQLGRTTKWDFGTGPGRNVGNLIVVSGDDNPLEEFGLAENANRPRKQRHSEKRSNVLAWDAFATTSSGNDCEWTTGNPILTHGRR